MVYFIHRMFAAMQQIGYNLQIWFDYRLSFAISFFFSISTSAIDSHFHRTRVSDAERQILALPPRHGGLVGQTNPQETAKTKYNYSTQITAKLTKSTIKNSNLNCNPSGQQYTRHMKNKIWQRMQK